MILHYKFDSLVDNRYYEGDWNGVYQDDLLTYSRIKNISYNGILKISKNKNNKKYYKEIIHEIINRIINWPYGMTGIFKSLDSTLKQDIAFDVKNKELQILLAKDSVAIASCLSLNRHLYKEAQLIILNYNKGALDSALATNSSLNKECQEILINRPYGRRNLVYNHNLDENIQISLAKDDDVYIRMALAGNKSINSKTIAILFNDNDKIVKDILDKTFRITEGRVIIKGLI